MVVHKEGKILLRDVTCIDPGLRGTKGFIQLSVQRLFSPKEKKGKNRERSGWCGE